MSTEHTTKTTAAAAASIEMMDIEFRGQTYRVMKGGVQKRGMEFFRLNAEARFREALELVIGKKQTERFIEANRHEVVFVPGDDPETVGPLVEDYNDFFGALNEAVGGNS